MTNPCKRSGDKHSDTQRERPREDGGRDGRDAASASGQEDSWRPPEPRPEAQGQFSRRNQPCQPSVLDSGLQNWEKSNLLF